MSQMSHFTTKATKPSQKSRNFFLTKNNPTESLEEFEAVLKHGAEYWACQYEKGEKEGTPHFQACMGYKNQRTFASIMKRFKGCNVEITKSPIAAFEYCQKEATRMPETVPLTGGVPPARRDVKGETAKRNKMIIDLGVKEAVDQGLIGI